ncbi:MAG TPA: T9SS type A sorting domain-containing protein [bacterium (Candidatus Stahlbacteria)]|nr:T9SS type A sorting domain-containing protein [Candidatus Stahlbacteria bacterium]
MRWSLVVLILVSLVWADWDIKYHDRSNIILYVSNFGEFGQKHGDRPDLEWPKGSGVHHLFGGGIWFGALSPDTCVTMGYNPNSGTGECVPGLVRQGTTAYYNPFVRVYIYPEDWPPPKDTFPMAPDTNLTFEDSWCCFNESDPRFHDSLDTHPIGVEFYQSGYADPRCPDAVFLRYTIKNCTTKVIKNCLIGIAIDPYHTSLMRYIFNRWFIIGNDSIYIDTLVFLTHPGQESLGMMGFYFLETPDQKGSLSCMRLTLEIDPSLDWQRYLIMKGIDYRNGDSIGFMPESNILEDFRFTYCTGPFNLALEEEKTFAFTICFGLDTLALVKMVDMARDFYNRYLAVAEKEGGVLKRCDLIYPNPTYGEINLTGDASEIHIFDPAGKLVKKLTPGPRLRLNLPAGVYFLRLRHHGRIRYSKLVILR